MQRSEIDARSELPVCPIGVCQGTVASYKNKGVQDRINRRDSIQLVPGQRPSGQAALPQSRTRFGYREFMKELCHLKPADAAN